MGKSTAQHLHQAVKSGDHDRVLALLNKHKKKDKQLLSALGDDGSTPLCSAVSAGDDKMVTLLIARGADCNTPDQSGWTPLHWAANNADLMTCRSLLVAGADPTIANRSGTTVLHLLSRINVKDEDEQQVLLEFLAMMVAQKAPVDALNKKGESPLHQATFRGNLVVMRFLLASNACLNLATHAGETPLHFAARAGHADAVEELLSQGADPTIVGQFGTPADVALTSNQTACFNLLCEKMGKDTQVQEGDLQGKMLQLLKHPELCPIFFAFLEKSFSHENIAFYILVEDFRQYWDVMDEVMRKKSAEMFVLDSATYQVNIDSILRKSLVENREKLTKDMFDSAQAYIITLMTNDSYIKFINSTTYQNYFDGKTVTVKTRKGDPLWEIVTSHFAKVVVEQERRLTQATSAPKLLLVDSPSPRRSPALPHPEPKPCESTFEFEGESIHPAERCSSSPEDESQSASSTASARRSSSQPTDSISPATSDAQPIASGRDRNFKKSPLRDEMAGTPSRTETEPMLDLSLSVSADDGPQSPSRPWSAGRSSGGREGQALLRSSMSALPSPAGATDRPTQKRQLNQNLKLRRQMDMATIKRPRSARKTGRVKSGCSLFDLIGHGVPTGFPWTDKMKRMASGDHESVDLSDSELGASKEAMEVLSAVIHMHTGTRSLDLSGNSLSDEFLTEISSGLCSHCSLESLDLSGNSLSAESVKTILSVLDQNTTLSRICLKDNTPPSGKQAIEAKDEAEIEAKLRSNTGAEVTDEVPVGDRAVKSRTEIVTQLAVDRYVGRVRGMLLMVNEVTSSSAEVFRHLHDTLLLLEQLSPHPHVLTYIGHPPAQDNRLVFFTSLHRRTLEQEIASRVQHRKFEPKDSTKHFFPAQWIRECGRALAKALSHLHRIGVVHAYLTRAAMSRLQCASVFVGHSFDSTAEVAVGGLHLKSCYARPRLVAPEVVGMSGLASLYFADLKKADVFGLGMVLFETASLKKPFHGSDVSRQPPMPILPTILPEHEEILRLAVECMSPDTLKRPTPEQVAERLSKEAKPST